MRTARIAVVVGVAAVLLLLARAWLSSDDDSRRDRLFDRQRSVAPPVPIPRSGRSDQSQPAIEAAAPLPASTGGAIRLVDIGGGAPLAGVPIKISSTNGAATAAATTSESGDVTFSVPTPVRLETDAPGVRLVLPKRVYDAPRSDALACRTVRVPCDVEVVDATDSRPLVQVLASPSHRDQGEWVADPKRVGSSEWLRQNAPDVAISRVTSTSTPIEIETPIFPEVTFAAAADGYLPDFATVALGNVDPRGVRVHLTLRKSRHVSVQVADDSGNPVAGATFQYAVTRRGRANSVNPAVEFMVRQATGAAFTATSSRTRDTSQVNEIVQARTDVNGMAGVDEPGRGDSTWIIVWAAGFEPSIQRRGATESAANTVDIRLRRFLPASSEYRLVRHGAVLKGVALVLAEKLDDDFMPSLPTIEADAEGRITSKLIVPGRRYYATVFDAATKRNYRGDIVFGGTSDVDADVLSE